MRVLLIDDERNLEADVIARTYEAGIAELKKERFDLLLLDHDLGEIHIEFGRVHENTGYDIMCFLEENPEYLPKRIECVSNNPCGRRRIEQVINYITSSKLIKFII